MAKTDLAKEVKSILSQETDFMKPLLQGMLQELLEEANFTNISPNSKCMNCSVSPKDFSD